MKLGEKISSLMEGLTPKQLLMMAGAAGILTFFVLYFGLSHLLGKKEESPVNQPAPVTMTKVVQAKSDIKEREQIRESMLQLVEVPSSMVPAGAHTDIKELIGRPVRVAVMAGDILTDRKVYRDVKQMGFTGIIPSDRRAISISVNDVTGVSGFMRPGDFVDVMLISEKADNSKISGEIIMQNIMLLAINNAAERAEDKDSKNSGGKDKKEEVSSVGKPVTATLAVRPEEELRLAVAAKAGQIYLALRPYRPSNMYVLDTEYFFFKGRPTQPSAPTAPRPSSASPQAMPASAGSDDPGSQMEIIRGTKATRGR